MLISATVGKKILGLASLTLKKDHEYICIHDFDRIDGKEENETGEGIKALTPAKLLHFYMELKIEDKIDTLFSFLKSHPKSKIIVFFSARK
jgi:ATP-dependent RNA helicase DDX10/DBP4